MTIDQRASDVAREWFAADPYNDYVRLQGLGVELSDEDQLWPEQSTSAIVLHHPQARFNV